jgi:hypothetical protein
MTFRADLEHAIKTLSAMKPEKGRRLLDSVDYLALGLELAAYELDVDRTRSEAPATREKALMAHAALTRLILDCKAIRLAAEKQRDAQKGRAAPSAEPHQETPAPAARKAPGGRARPSTALAVVEAELVDEEPVAGRRRGHQLELLPGSSSVPLLPSRST